MGEGRERVLGRCILEREAVARSDDCWCDDVSLVTVAFHRLNMKAWNSFSRRSTAASVLFGSEIWQWRRRAAAGCRDRAGSRRGERPSHSTFNLPLCVSYHIAATAAMTSPNNERDGRLTASSSRRALTMGSSVVFTPQSQERPLLDRLESVQVGAKGPKLPAPPPRAEEEGVTATTSSLHHSRRPSRKATGGSTSGSFDFGQPSRSSTTRSRPLSGLNEEAVSSPAPTQGKSRFPRQLLKPTRLIDLHELRPDIKGLSILPTVHFPGQGSGRESEFLQEEPIWARKPWKWLYMVRTRRGA